MKIKLKINLKREARQQQEPLFPNINNPFYERARQLIA